MIGTERERKGISDYVGQNPPKHSRYEVSKKREPLSNSIVHRNLC